MAARKKVVDTTMQYAALMAKLEGGKVEIPMGQWRQAVSYMEKLETALYVAGYKSAVLMIRRNAVKKGKVIVAKKKAVKAKMKAKKAK
jgi:hypothetical protein